MSSLYKPKDPHDVIDGDITEAVHNFERTGQIRDFIALTEETTKDSESVDDPPDAEGQDPQGSAHDVVGDIATEGSVNLEQQTTEEAVHHDVDVEPQTPLSDVPAAVAAASDSPDLVSSVLATDFDPLDEHLFSDGEQPSETVVNYADDADQEDQGWHLQLEEEATPKISKQQRSHVRRRQKRKRERERKGENQSSAPALAEQIGEEQREGRQLVGLERIYLQMCMLTLRKRLTSYVLGLEPGQPQLPKPSSELAQVEESQDTPGNGWGDRLRKRSKGPGAYSE
ncbi:uncharacterized protein LOC113214665 [Frankliniella occidentalis]|uniref:Uncharacterized protein LOC113214665 n=1 Tax=Frankliniella occidentalis TaxID=133901 RepID=A0A9C6X6I4_FRAOC|nr:uncharacterized protein LOC113214665 [Frankliniella occidentalis]